MCLILSAQEEDSPFPKTSAVRGSDPLRCQESSSASGADQSQDVSAVTQTAWARTMTDTFSQRKGDREGDGTEYREKDFHKVM